MSKKEYGAIVTTRGKPPAEDRTIYCECKAWTETGARGKILASVLKLEDVSACSIEFISEMDANGFKTATLNREWISLAAFGEVHVCVDTLSAPTEKENPNRMQHVASSADGQQPLALVPPSKYSKTETKKSGNTGTSYVSLFNRKFPQELLEKAAQHNSFEERK